MDSLKIRNKTRKKLDIIRKKNENSYFDFLIIFISFYSPKCIKVVGKIFYFLCNFRGSLIINLKEGRSEKT